MHTPSYVYQNGFGIYYFRMAIPKHLKPVLGKHEIRKSLKTTNFSYAVRKARQFAVISEELFRSGIRDKRDLVTAFRAGITHFSDEHINANGFCGNRGYPAGQKDGSVNYQSSPGAELPVQPSLKLKELIDQ